MANEYIGAITKRGKRYEEMDSIDMQRRFVGFAV